MATQQEKSSNNLSNKPNSNIMSPTSDPEEPSKKQNAVMEWLLGKLKIFVTSAFRMNSLVSLQGGQDHFFPKEMAITLTKR